MRSHLPYARGGFLLLLVAACSSAEAPLEVEPTLPEETVGESIAPIIAPNRTEVVAYENQGGDEGLPATIPVVVSYGPSMPSVAIRIDCGSNYGHMLAGFGYPPDLNLDTVDHFASLEALQESLRAKMPEGQDVPLRTLRCETDEAALRNQVLAVYRTVDADASKGQSDYYVRLREDPGSVYALGCWNLVSALGWSQGTVPPAVATPVPGRTCSWGCGWSDAVTVPIDKNVLAAWTSQGVVQRELNCYVGRGVALPPVDRNPFTQRAPVTPSDRAQLYRVRYAFDGISAPMPLYLIANGKGYAIDCGSNQEGIKAALGLPPDVPVTELATSSSVFLDSAPGAQPNLRCSNPNGTLFQASDGPERYFHFDDTSTLFDFTCKPTADFFASGLKTVTVPAASIPHLFPNANDPDARTRVLRVGCVAPNECAEKTATCAEHTYCADDYVGYHCNTCATGMSSDRPSQLADVNGDGKMDLVAFGSNGTLVALSNGTSFGPATLWLAAFGDSPAAGGWTEAKNVRLLADVNGDKKADIVGFGDAGVMVALSKGTSFAAPTQWVAGYGQNGGWRVDGNLRMLADVDGDGKADVVGFANAGVTVSKSTGTAFAAASIWIPHFGKTSGGWTAEKHPRMMADVNGDKKADVVGFSDGGVMVALSTGTAFSTQKNWVVGYNNPTWTTTQHVRVTADVNGDGKADVVGFGNDGVYASLSSGTAFAAPVKWIGGFAINSGGWMVDKHPRLVVDMNGDKKADVVGFGEAGVHVALSTGAKFNNGTLWSSEYGAASGKWTVADRARLLGDVSGDGKPDVVGLASDGVLTAVSTGSAFGTPQASFANYELPVCINP